MEEPQEGKIEGIQAETRMNRIDTNLLTANCVSLRQEVLNLTVSGALDQQYVHGVLAE